MTKKDFLDELKSALSSRVSAQETAEHLAYYEDYINTQVRMGRTEEEVVLGLGEPRLLARNIADSKKYSSDGSKNTYQSTGQYTDNAARQNSFERNQNTRRFKIPGWLLAVIIVIVFLVFFGLLFSVLSFLAPVLIPVAFILLIIRLWRST